MPTDLVAISHHTLFMIMRIELNGYAISLFSCGIFWNRSMFVIHSSLENFLEFFAYVYDICAMTTTSAAATQIQSCAFYLVLNLLNKKTISTKKVPILISF